MPEGLAQPLSATGSAAGNPSAADLRARRSWAGSFTSRFACSAALGAGAVAVLGLDGGGYFTATWIWAALAFAAVAAIGLLARELPALHRLAWLSLISLVGLGLWMLASHLWGIPGTEAEREAARAGVYVAGLGAFLVVVERTTVKAFLVGVLAGVVGLECLALGQKAVGGGGAPDPTQGSLLVGSIGYANALGILATVAVLLALGLSWDEQRLTPRGLLLVSGFISAVALALTSSRGALISLGVGLLVLVALWLRRGRESTRRRWWLATIPAAVATAALLVVAQPSLGDRPAYWRVAADDVVRRPVLGSGAGTFDDVWYANRPITANVRDAHNLYLEVLAELGPVGLVLLLGLLVPPLLAIARSLDTSIVPVAAAGYAAFLVHAGLDWDWEMPATTLAGLACGAALLVSARRSLSVS